VQEKYSGIGKGGSTWMRVRMFVTPLFEPVNEASDYPARRGPNPTSALA
jgi:hypothetical protein